MERAAVGVRGLDDGRHLDVGVVEDADARHVREARAPVLLRADDLARQAADAELRIGEDDAVGELRRARGRAAREAEAADGLERDERDDRRACFEEIPPRELGIGDRLVASQLSIAHGDPLLGWESRRARRGRQRGSAARSAWVSTSRKTPLSSTSRSVRISLCRLMTSWRFERGSVAAMSSRSDRGSATGWPRLPL